MVVTGIRAGIQGSKIPQTHLCSIQSHASALEQTLTPVLVLREAGNPPGQA